MRFMTLIAAIAAFVLCFNCSSEDHSSPSITPISAGNALASVSSPLGENNGAEELVCDGADNDGDGSVDDGCDSDQDGWCEDGKIVSSFVACVFGPGDCNDTNENVNPGMNEVCNGVDDNCDDKTDRYANGLQLWQNCYTGDLGTENIGKCHAGISWCDNGAYVPCQGEVTPVAEKCDGNDNDCDSATDEDFPTLGMKCDGADSDQCKEGVFQCDGAGGVACSDKTGNTVEVCDGATDEDCDGLVDEGLTQTCTDFVTCKQYESCGPCPAAPKEVCDYLDNNCKDGVDEGFEEVGDACDGSDADFCGMGTWACNEDGTVVCNEEVSFTETCDNLDNDCNGVVDDPFVANKGKPCDGPDSDQCQNGAYACAQDGSSLECTNESKVNIAESCNKFDDDCNGVVDDNPTDAGGSCGPEQKGDCKPGVVICDNGNLTCAGSVEPSPEKCDGNDNDCNGQTDNGFSVGALCDGKDTDLCPEGVVVCDGQGGTVCSDTTGDTVETCDGVDNDCNGIADFDAFPTKGKSCDGPDADKCTLGVSSCKPDKTGLECSPEWATFAEDCAKPGDEDCDGEFNEGCPTEEAFAEFCVKWILNGVALKPITVMGTECTASGCSDWGTLEFEAGPTSSITWCPALDQVDDLVEWNIQLAPKYQSPFGYPAEWVAHGLESAPEVVGIVGAVLMSSEGELGDYMEVLKHDLYSADLEICTGPFCTTMSANEGGGFNFVTVRTAGGG